MLAIVSVRAHHRLSHLNLACCRNNRFEFWINVVFFFSILRKCPFEWQKCICSPGKTHTKVLLNGVYHYGSWTIHKKYMDRKEHCTSNIFVLFWVKRDKRHFKHTSFDSNAQWTAIITTTINSRLTIINNSPKIEVEI